MTAAEVSLAGEIDMTTSAAARELLAEGADEAIRLQVPLRIDLGAVTFLDSSGLACLAGALARVRGAGLPLQLARVPSPIQRLLEIVGLDEACDIEPA